MVENPDALKSLFKHLGGMKYEKQKITKKQTRLLHKSAINRLLSRRYVHTVGTYCKRQAHKLTTGLHNKPEVILAVLFLVGVIVVTYLVLLFIYGGKLSSGAY